jgi:hypothetical protein
MFTPVTRVPTAPTHQQPISKGVMCLARECAEIVTILVKGAGPAR